MNITKRQREILDCIESFVDENGFAPSYEEIRVRLGLKSLATVHKHTHNLRERGWLKFNDNRSRSLEVVPQESKPRFIQKGPDCMWDTVLECWWKREKK